jgi:CRISPR-associated protein Cas2
LMQYWVCYDVADDRRRQRLSDVLLDFGTRVQESVFQCLIDPPLAEEMMARVRRTIEKNTDKVHVVALCDACAGRVVTVGITRQASDPETLII